MEWVQRPREAMYAKIGKMRKCPPIGLNIPRNYFWGLGPGSRAQRSGLVEATIPRVAPKKETNTQKGKVFQKGSVLQKGEVSLKRESFFKKGEFFFKNGRFLFKKGTVSFCPFFL